MTAKRLDRTAEAFAPRDPAGDPARRAPAEHVATVDGATGFQLAPTPAGAPAPPFPPRRYILTGTPGAGKTSLLHGLAGRGYAVVAEAATDVIAADHARGLDEPWKWPAFIEDIVRLQRERQLAAPRPGTAVQVFDRSPVCTLALCEFLGGPAPPELAAELDRILAGRIYQRRVFFVRNLGFLRPTAARRISFEDSLEFERLHERAYRSLGFDLVEVPAGTERQRLDAVAAHLPPAAAT